MENFSKPKRLCVRFVEDFKEMGIEDIAPGHVRFPRFAVGSVIWNPVGYAELERSPRGRFVIGMKIKKGYRLNQQTICCGIMSTYCLNKWSDECQNLYKTRSQLSEMIEMLKDTENGIEMDREEGIEDLSRQVMTIDKCILQIEKKIHEHKEYISRVFSLVIIFFKKEILDLKENAKG